MTRTLNDVKKQNKEIGNYFWSSETIKFFESRDETELIRDMFFVYSIQPPYGPRAYKVGFVAMNGSVSVIMTTHRDSYVAREWINDNCDRFQPICDGGCDRDDIMAVKFPLKDGGDVFFCYDCWATNQECVGTDRCWHDQAMND